MNISEKNMLKNFQIGDKVEIVNRGSYYPTYIGWAKFHKAVKFITDGLDSTNIRIGIIKSIGRHDYKKVNKKNKDILCLVDLGEVEIIITITAIRLLARGNVNNGIMIKI